MNLNFLRFFDEILVDVLSLDLLSPPLTNPEATVRITRYDFIIKD